MANWQLIKDHAIVLVPFSGIVWFVIRGAMAQQTSKLRERIVALEVEVKNLDAYLHERIEDMTNKIQLDLIEREELLKLMGALGIGIKLRKEIREHGE